LVTTPPSNRARDRKCLLLAQDVLSGDVQLDVEGTDLHVGTGYIAGQGDEHIVVGSDRCEKGTAGRLDSAPHLAPDVEFPTDLRAERELPESVADGRVGCRDRDPVVARRRTQLLLLRVELADGDPELCARLEDADARSQECKILLIGEVDQIRQHRVVERRPPLAILRAAGIDRPGAGLHPVVGDLYRRALEVRTDHASGRQQGKHPGDPDASNTPVLSARTRTLRPGNR